MSIEIFPLTLEKLDQALQVWEATLGTDFMLERQEVVNRLQNGQGIFYVAVDTDSNRIVGVKFGFIDEDTCIGRGIGVLPAYRRQGVAKRLVRQFEQDLQAMPAVKLYAFGSGTTEGVPFHIVMGYFPKALVQFTDQNLRPNLDFSAFNITHDGYNDQHQVYQIFIAIDQSQANLDYLRNLQVEYPQVNVQYFFEKTFHR